MILEFERALDLLETFWKEFSPTSHAKIRGLTAIKLFGFEAASTSSGLEDKFHDALAAGAGTETSLLGPNDL